jgi:hypothetical protein
MLTRRRLEPGIECKQIAKCGGGGGGSSSAIWLLLGHQLDALILCSLTSTHHPHQPLPNFTEGKEEEEEEEEQQQQQRRAPLWQFSHRGKTIRLIWQNTYAHTYTNYTKQ